MRGVKKKHTQIHLESNHVLFYHCDLHWPNPMVTSNLCNKLCSSGHTQFRKQTRGFHAHFLYLAFPFVAHALMCVVVLRHPKPTNRTKHLSYFCYLSTAVIKELESRRSSTAPAVFARSLNPALTCMQHFQLSPSLVTNVPSTIPQPHNIHFFLGLRCTDVRSDHRFVSY